MDEAKSDLNNSPSLIGWGMSLLAIGAVLLAGNLPRREAEQPPGLIVVSVVLLLLGWVLLTAGMVKLAQAVDRLSRTRDGAPTPPV